MRLGVMLPAMVIGPAGLVLYGLTAQHNLHWMGYFSGVVMVDWAAYFYYTFALAVWWLPNPFGRHILHPPCY